MHTRHHPVPVLVAILAVSLVWAAAGSAAGQTVWTRPYQNNQISVELIAPSFEDDAVKLASGAAYLSGTYSLNENIELVAEVPTAQIDSGGVTESVIGNPYFGVGLSGLRTPFLIEIGVRIPVVGSPGPATFAGSFTDVGRTRAFRYDETLVAGFLNWRFEFSRRTSLRVRSGLVYAEFPNVVDGNRRIEQDLRIKYSPQIWYEGDNAILGLTLAGRGTFTAPGSYGQKSLHWISGQIIGNFDYIRPGLVFGISLNDDVRVDAPYFFGLTLSTSYDN
jgi:hypothetical protein